ncbi:MAG: endolytic transglycosylase MltG, partial [Bacteroidetes bacterium]|nr:endolytic transglycosylase MltG [Bacteroidota bacterium]
MEYRRAKYSRKRKKSKLARAVYTTLFLLIILSLIVAYQLYRAILKPNTWVHGRQSAFLYIPTGSDFEDMKANLYKNGFVINRPTFEWLAKRKNLPNHIHPGKYTIMDGMSNDQLINMLRSGSQTHVNLVINSYRTKQDFAGRVTREIEPDSSDIITLLYDSAYLTIFGFNPETILTMVIPNTYQVYWNISAKELFDRMYAEYNSFWNTARRQKADRIGLDPVEVSVLASIVEKETNKDDEKPDIAGVYLNRIKMGWRLQADPTLVFAIGDFTINRVLNTHKGYDSPYNTYIYTGLPPGPICIPSIASIDAVLNRSDHKYL